jgi:hypothetical protein
MNQKKPYAHHYKAWLAYFDPIFHCGLYCRAVYNAERLLFHSFSSNLKQKIEYDIFVVLNTTVQSQFSDTLFSDKSRFSDNFEEDHFFST